MGKIYIKEWFANKIDLGYGKRLASTEGTIEKETEKAYLLVVEWYSADGEYEGYSKTWCPKSCTMTAEEYEAEQEAEAKRFNDGCDRYNKMIEFAKANGIKGIRVGLRRATIEKKIADAGLVFLM